MLVVSVFNRHIVCIHCHAWAVKLHNVEKVENANVIRAHVLRPEETPFGLYAILITTFQVDKLGSLMVKKVQDVIENFWRRAGLGHVPIATSRFEPSVIWYAALIFRLKLSPVNLARLHLKYFKKTAK